MVEISLANWEPIAKAAYEAYKPLCEPMAGIPLREWEELTPKIKDAWIAASKKAAEEVLKTQ